METLNGRPPLHLPMPRIPPRLVTARSSPRRRASARNWKISATLLLPEPFGPTRAVRGPKRRSTVSPRLLKLDTTTREITHEAYGQPLTSRTPSTSELAMSSRPFGEHLLYDIKGGSLRSPPAPAAGGRKRPSSPAPARHE